MSPSIDEVEPLQFPTYEAEGQPTIETFRFIHHFLL